MSWLSLFNSTNNKAAKSPKTSEELRTKVLDHYRILEDKCWSDNCKEKEIAKICSYVQHTPITDTTKIGAIIVIMRNFIKPRFSKPTTLSPELEDKCNKAITRLEDFQSGKLTVTTSSDAPLPPTIGNYGGKRKLRTQKRSKTYMKLTCKCTIRRTKKGSKARKTRKQ